MLMSNQHEKCISRTSSGRSNARAVRAKLPLQSIHFAVLLFLNDTQIKGNMLQQNQQQRPARSSNLFHANALQYPHVGRTTAQCHKKGGATRSTSLLFNSSNRARRSASVKPTLSSLPIVTLFSASETLTQFLFTLERNSLQPSPKWKIVLRQVFSRAIPFDGGNKEKISQEKKVDAEKFLFHERRKRAGVGAFAACDSACLCNLRLARESKAPCVSESLPLFATCISTRRTHSCTELAASDSRCSTVDDAKR